MFFNEYPYRNITDFNLYYIFRELQKVKATLQEYVERSTISFHDPIMWDITDQYTANTMVIDSDGTAYLSVQAVPAGIAITNTTYWQPIFNYDDLIHLVMSNIAQDTRDTGVLPADGAVNDLVWFQGNTYYLTTDLPGGSIVIPGTNAEAVTVNDWVRGFVQALNTSIGNVAGDLVTEETNRTNADNALSGRINQEILDRQAADNALGGRIDQEILDRQAADNSLSGDITAEETARIAADNALNTRIDNVSGIAQFKELFANKRIAIVGDSLSVESTNTWALAFKNICDGIGSTVTNFSVNGATTASMLTILQGNSDIFDVAIVWLGINDAGSNVPIGNVLTPGSFAKNYKDIIDNLYSRNSEMNIYALGVSFWKDGQYSATHSPLFYTAAIRNICSTRGVAFKDMANLLRASVFNGTAQYPDGVHFLPDYSNSVVLCTIINKLLTGTSEVFSQTITLSQYCFTPAEDVSFVLIDGFYNIGNSVTMTLTLNVASEIAANDPIVTVTSTMKPSNSLYYLVYDALYNTEFWFLDTNGVLQCNANVPAGTYTITMSYAPVDSNAATFISA